MATWYLEMTMMSHDKWVYEDVVEAIEKGVCTAIK
jgi:hypothetical protein